MEDMEEQIKIEKDYIILNSIVKYGYSAMPLDYAFLTRYSLKNIYIDIVKNLTVSHAIGHLEKAGKAQAKLYLSTECSLSAFKLFRKENGDQKTKELLGNKTYWKVFLSILKKDKR